MSSGKFRDHVGQADRRLFVDVLIAPCDSPILGCAIQRYALPSAGSSSNGPGSTARGKRGIIHLDDHIQAAFVSKSNAAPAINCSLSPLIRNIDASSPESDKVAVPMASSVT